VNLRELERKFGRRLARVTTNAVVARPGLWRVFRWSTRAQFDRLAPSWDSMRRPEAFAAFELALEALPAAPKRVLDLGTGTGLAAFIAARRFPEAEVVGVDLAEGMVEQARQNTPPENMIPFFDELARVAAPGGHLVLSFSAGPETPIWVPPERLRRELGLHGFMDFADFEAEGGTALLARKHDRV